MKIASVWIVRDPTERSEMCDCCWEQQIDKLEAYIKGSPDGAWESEHHTLYLDEAEALRDAEARFRMMIEKPRAAAARSV